jgi:hypothetical protein
MYIHNYSTKTTKSCNLERPELLDKYYLKCCKTSQNELDFKLVKQLLLIDRFRDFPLKPDGSNFTILGLLPCHTPRNIHVMPQKTIREVSGDVWHSKAP